MRRLTLAERSKKLRERTGWTQKELAERLGVSGGAVAQYETDIRTNPRRKVLARLRELEKNPLGAPVVKVGEEARLEAIELRLARVEAAVVELKRLILGQTKRQ